MKHVSAMINMQDSPTDVPTPVNFDHQLIASMVAKEMNKFFENMHSQHTGNTDVAQSSGNDSATAFHQFAVKPPRLLHLSPLCYAMASSNADDAAKSPSSPKNVYKDPDDGRQRFLLELEFVQCLANPTYIHYLAQNRYFEDEAFIGYLKYLQYWQRPEYIKFIMYPHCLFFLELLQNANFRNAMAHPGNKELAHRQQFYFWKNYRNNRLKHILPRPLPEPSPQPPASTASSLPLVAAMPPTSAPPPALSPMQFSTPPGSGLAKNDTRNSAIDRRKRKKEG